MKVLVQIGNPLKDWSEIVPTICVASGKKEAFEFAQMLANENGEIVRLSYPDQDIITADAKLAISLNDTADYVYPIVEDEIVEKKKKHFPVQISDLLAIIHYTIIKQKGENDIILKELEAIDLKIQNNELEDYDVTDTTFWKTIANKLKQS